MSISLKLREELKPRIGLEKFNTETLPGVNVTCQLDWVDIAGEDEGEGPIWLLVELVAAVTQEMLGNTLSIVVF
jgi:hypothetical protein